MKVVSLTAENFKRLRAVHIEPDPDGNLIVVAGRNAQGKSSVLDAIWAALAGAAGVKDTPRPIRDGEDEARISLDLGDLKVTRTWRGEKTSLKVEDADGGVKRSPQTLLDSLIGSLSFDPLAFAQQPAKEQRATLLDLLGLDFTAADAQRQRVFDERTDVNRDVKRLDAQIEGVTTGALDVPDSEIDIAALTQQISDALGVVARRDAMSADYRQTKALLETNRLRLERLRKEAADLEELMAAQKDDLVELRTKAEGLTVPDIAALREQLAGAETTNQAVRAVAERRRLQEQRRAAHEQAEALTGQLGDLDNAKLNAITAAMTKAPVTGLGFDDEGVTYNGVPFSQSSAAERLRVSLAMAIALNPEIRVIRITDGSLLDSDNMRLVAELADAHDCQVWVERVDETGSTGVLIEDGAVVDAARPALSLVGAE